jgi:hypothetical protein
MWWIIGGGLNGNIKGAAISMAFFGLGTRLSTLSRNIHNAPPTVYAVTKPQRRKFVDSGFHRIYVSSQSWFKRKESHYQSSSQREMIPISIPTI